MAERSRQNRSKKNGGMAGGAVLLIMIASLAVYVYMEMQSSPAAAPDRYIFAGNDTLIQFNYEDKGIAYSSGTGTGFFFSTKDGMKYITAKGELKFEYPYSVQNAIIKGDGECIGVTDLRGSALYVFDSVGLKYVKPFDEQIITFSVNAAGYSCVVLRDGSDYQIKIMTDTGAEIMSKYFTDPNVYPIAVDISSDSRILAYCLLDTNGINISSNIFFLYTSKNENQQNIETPFSYIGLSGELTGVLKFMQNNLLLALSDRSLICIDVESRSEESKKKWVMPLNNRVDKVAFWDDKYFALAMGEGFTNSNSDPLGLLKIYQIDLNLIAQYEFGKKITGLQPGSRGLIVGSGQDFKGFNNKGSLLWEYTAPSDISQILFLNNTNTILTVSRTNAAVMKRTRASKMEENIQ